MSQSKEQILAIAFKLFFKKGYKGVTMKDLVEASGLSKGAVYHYFSSKEDLYNHTMEQFLTQYLDSFELEYDQNLTLRENIKSLFGRFSPMTEQMNTSTEEAAEGLSNYLIFLQSLMRKPEFKSKLQKYNENFYLEFSKWIRIAQDKDEIKKSMDPWLLAVHLTALMKGLGVLYAFVDQSEPLADTFNKIMDQFFTNIESESDEKNDL
jgi:AcrR family transcriptional regulator